jgi:hypothetical protein
MNGYTYDCGGNSVFIGANGNTENLTGRAKIEQDLAFGLPKEDAIINNLATYFHTQIEKTTQYCVYDAHDKEDNDIKYEIKSRRCKHTQYATTIIPVHKTKVSHKILKFVFHFTTGLFYITYDKKMFDTLKIKSVGAYRKNGEFTYEDHYEIPIGMLIPIII